jgi:hypothetical protein
MFVHFNESSAIVMLRFFMNDRFLFCIATKVTEQMPQFLRCVRMQRKNRIHSMGSNLPLAASAKADWFNFTGR